MPCNYRMWEELLLIWAIPMTWFYLIFFAGAIKLTGPFVTMIFSMITGDMFTFSMIYIIFLFGFSQSFYFLQYNVDDADLYEEYHTTYVGLFQMTLGEYEVSKTCEFAELSALNLFNNFHVLFRSVYAKYYNTMAHSINVIGKNIFKTIEAIRFRFQSMLWQNSKYAYI